MANNVSVELSMNTTGYQEGINGAIDSTKKYETEVRKVSESTVNFRKEFIKAKREVQNLAAGYAQLDKEAKKSAFGREMARQLQEAKDKAAEFVDLQGDLNTELKNLASDTRTLDLLSEGFGVIGDSVSTAMGVIAQFTGNEEDAQKAVVMFTTVTSALSAVTRIQNALQMQSNTMLAVTRIQNLAATAATNLKTAAEGKSIVTTKAATVAQALFNKVAYANPYVLLAVAITGVIAALAAFIIFSGKAEDAQEAENKAKERAQAVNDAYYDTYNNNLSETLGNYTKLQVEWKNLKSEGEKNQWIKDNADKFHELGYEIDDTGAAEKFFVANEAEVIASFVARAEAAALAAQQVEIFNQALRDMPKPGEIKSAEWFSKQGLSTKGRSDKNTGFMRFEYQYEVTEEDLKSIRDKRLADARKTATQLGELQLKAEQKANKRAAEVGVNTYKKTRDKLLKSSTNSGSGSKAAEVINVNSLEYAENKLKGLQQQLSKIDITDLKAVESLQKQIEDAKKEVSKRKITLGLEIETKIVDGSSGWWDKKIKDLQDAQKQLVEGSAEWFNIDEQIKSLEDARKIMTEGVTVSGTDMSKLLNPDKTKRGLEDAISGLQNKLQDIDWSTPEGEAQFDRYVEKIQEFKGELSTLSEVWEDAMMTPTEKAQKKLEETADTINSVGNAISATSELFSALGDVAGDEDLQVAGIVAKAVATVALSFAQALTTAKSWVEWLAFGVTGLTTMISMISSIKQATAGSYAQGGIIGGSSYSGDRLLANVNSGEMILNSRQQRNLFNLLDTGTMPQRGGTNVQVTGVVRGTDLLLVQKNTNKVRAKSGSQIYF